MTLTEEIGAYFTERGLYVLTEKDTDRYLEVMTDSFVEYPLIECVTGENSREKTEIFQSVSIKGMDGNCITVADSDEINGIICFYRPGTRPGSSSFIFNGGISFIYKFGLLRTLKSISYMSRMGHVMDRYRKRNDIYIYFLATHPSMQGKGIGARLVRAVFDYCDENGYGAYLETNDEANVGFYEKCGFRLMETVRAKIGNDMKLFAFYREAGR